MKKRIKLFLFAIIVIQSIFSIRKTKATELSTNANYTTEQMAIREIADAFYRRGIYSQYGTAPTMIYSPEDATSQHSTFYSCSRYIFSIYYQSFGIKLLSPTGATLACAAKYYDANNIVTNDIIEYWEKTTNENGNIEYKDNQDNIKNIDLSTENGIKEYATKILKEYKLQVGDLIAYHTDNYNDAGHTVIVYDIIYDENGEPTDAVLRESTSKYEKKTTKLSDGFSYADIYNENNDVHEGTFKELYLVNSYRTSSDITRDSVLYTLRNKSYFSIVRPLLKNENGEYTGKYYYATIKADNDIIPLKYECTGRTLTDYSITETALNRINYSAMYIEKTVDVFNNSVVSLGDELEYTIKITNNSDTAYTAFDVVENIPEYVEVIDKENINIKNNTIIWNIPNLEAKQSIEIKYKVKVKNNVTYLGKEIVSTGTVAGIPSSTVKNTISRNLTEEEKIIIKNKLQTILEEKIYYGKEIVSKIYDEEFQLNLNIENLDLTNLIKTRNTVTYFPPGSSYTPTIYLNTDNEYNNMIVSNYYGALYTSSDGRVRVRNWENHSDNYQYFGSRDKRADSIYRENFQTGDILIYKNTQTENNSTLYKTENGMYYLIYIDKKDKIAINGQEIYGFIGVNENGEINNIYRDKSDYETYLDYSINDLRTLLGKDYYVVLRPSMTLDIFPMELQLNYDTTEITNQDVKVTITSNEEMLPIENWTLSEDKKTLTKTYTKNIKEEVKVYDYGGNEKTMEIKIENIDKEKPVLEVTYSTTNTTNQDVIVTITSNEEINNVSEWTLSEDKKKLTKTYTENKTENIEVIDIAGNISTALIDIKNIDKEPVFNETYSIDETNKYISKIMVNTEIDMFTSNITLSNGYGLDVDTKEINNKRVLYTGGKTRITKGLELYKEYTNIVIGDINGDGAINSADLLKIRQHLLRTNVLSGAYFLSSDINYDNTINSADLLRVRQHLLGTKPIE